MAKDLAQIYAANPVTTIGNTDLAYLGVGGTVDGAIAGSDLKALFASSTLASARIYVGNAGNVATAVAMSGDATISNTGAVTVTKINGVSVLFPLSLANGGTNAALVANNGGIFYSTGTAGAILAGTATAGQVLRSGASGAPSWSTATYPATAANAARILRSDGTNWVETTATFADIYAASSILYSNGASNIAGLATANNGLPVTGNTGIPVMLAGPGTTGNVLQSNAAAAPSFSTATYPSTTTANQLLYSSGNNVVAGLATAANGILVTSSGSVPSISSTLPAAVLGNITKPTVQTFLSGSGTYTTPANVTYIRVIAVAGGGGGAGSSDSSANGGNGGTGGNTTFGVTVIALNGGVGGANAATNGGAGGTASLSGAVGLSVSGGNGGVGALIVTTASLYSSGGHGGSSGLGGNGGGGQANSAAAAGTAGRTNTGGGGGGASVGGIAGAFNGAGGGAGAYCDVIITSPAATYAYAIGAAGAAGTAGTSGAAGGAGGSGGIWVFEYYV